MISNYFRRRGLACFFIVLLCYHELGAVSQLDGQRVKLGLSAVRSISRALTALDFVSWVTKITTVAAPLLSVVIIVVDIIFSFLDIESPEMILMKSEFKNLNNRLESFSMQFQEVKKKIDWSSIQLTYGDIESTILTLNKQRTELANVKTDSERKSVANTFIRKYENDFNLASEKLATAMSTGSTLSDNIFEATRKYTDQHPVHSFHFMKGCIQLLLQGIAIQGTYIHLKYNNTDADEYFKKISTEQMYAVAQKAREVYNTMQKDWRNQLKEDVNRILLANLQLSHEEMAKKLYHYFGGKYEDRSWLVHAYNDITGWEEHSSFVCDGGNFFRIGGRNVNIASFVKSKDTGFDEKWATKILDSFGEFRQNDGGAQAVMNKVLQQTGQQCSRVKAVIAIGDKAHGYLIAGRGRYVHKEKAVKWCNTDLCWVMKIRYYYTLIYG